MRAGLKRLEVMGKTLGALLWALFVWRPGRKARAVGAVSQARRILLVRLDNRVGEALLMTPLCSALKQSPKGYSVDVLVHPKVARVLEGHPDIDRLFTLKRGGSLGALRKAGYDAVIHCTNWTAPSVGGAIVTRRLAGRAVVVGPAQFPVGALADVPVKPLEGVRSEVAQRLHLLSPLEPQTGPQRLSFRGPRRSRAQGEARPLAVVNPGGRLGWRRIPPSAFAAAARELERQGILPVVTWGPGEEGLAQEVVSLAPGSELAPPTDLDALADLMARAQVTVCNNTGPMHLSVAVGTPTLALFLRMDMERWGHAYAPHQMVDLTPHADSPLALESVVTQEVRAMLERRGLSQAGNPPTAR